MRIHTLSVRQILVLAASPQLVWGWHCWDKSPLYAINLQTSLDSLREYAQCSLDPTSPASTPGRLEDYGPWTHAPVCTPVLQSINDTLCVYTNASFANNRGISIFTTPTLAKAFASLPAFRDPAALTAQGINQPTDAYRATPIPGRGLGMLASRPLKFGDRVTAYTPAFVAYLETELSTPDREAIWRVAIEQLPEALRSEFLSLATVYGDERIRVQDVVKANTFQIVLEGANHLAIWPETSRLNHECAPNAQYAIDTELLTHVVRVTRPIAEGEEITIVYTSPLELTETRQQHLQHGFHFTCTCRRCTSPSSDTILREMKNLQDQLNSWSPDSAASPAMAEHLLTLYQDEGLEGFMDIGYGFAALAYSAVGDASKALMYAKKGKEALLMKEGKWAPNLKLFDSLISDLRGHWSWRRRL